MARRRHISRARFRVIVDVDERFRKENVTPPWYRRSAYLLILGIIIVIVVLVAYDAFFAPPPGPQPYVQQNP
jgi:hypothetical protein